MHFCDKYIRSVFFQINTTKYTVYENKEMIFVPQLNKICLVPIVIVHHSPKYILIILLTNQLLELRGKATQYQSFFVCSHDDSNIFYDPLCRHAWLCMMVYMLG